MSKKKAVKPDIQKEADYYKLKTKAVQDLAEANEGNAPEYSEEELKKYRSRGGIKLSDGVKLVLVKWWFAGAVCFFFIWGLGTYVADMLDMLVITGIALGIVTDLLTNNALRFMEKTKGAADRFIMVTIRGYISFILNIFYAYLLLALVFILYNLINRAALRITGAVDTVPLGVGPILFGLFYTGFDLLLIEVKHLIAGMFAGRPKKDTVHVRGTAPEVRKQEAKERKAKNRK